MKFSPVNIKNQQFTKSMRGYDRDEVHAFLEKLADEVEKLNSENDSLRKELEKANQKLNEYRKIEKNLQDTLLKAHESSSKSVESAKKQSLLMLKEAELKAAQIVEKARESADEIRNAVLNLREEKNVIIAKLKALVNSQAGLLEIRVENDEKEKHPLIKSTQEPEMPDINIDKILDKLL